MAGDFVVVAEIDDRAILEGFRSWKVKAAQSGAEAGKALNDSFSKAAAQTTAGATLLKELERSAARFPNVISSQLTRAASAASTPATQLGTMVAKGVQGGADKIPTVIAAALASATSKASGAGQQLGTAIGTGAQAPLSKLLNASIATSLSSAAGPAQKGGQQIGTGLAGGVRTSLEQLMPSALTRGFTGAPAVGTAAGKALAGGVTQAAQQGLQQVNVFRPLAEQGSGTARTLLSEYGRTGAGLLASSAGLKAWVDEQGRVRTATGLVVPEINKLSTGLKGAADQTQNTSRKFGDLIQSTSIMEGAVGGLAFALTNALGNAASSALQGIQQLVAGYAALDSELRLASAAAGENGGYDRLAESVNKVGIEAAGTTLEVAKLATSLVRAGFTVDQVTEAMPGIVRGAEATGTSFESMGSIVGATLRGFALDVDETSRVVDVLVNTANSSNASIEGLGYTMQYAAPVAKALNIALEDVAAASGLMANAGIDASVAGTGLRTGLERLQKAAAGASNSALGLGVGQEQLGKAMRLLGAEITKTNGELLPLDQVLLRLKDRFAELSTAEKVQISSVLFGEESGSKFLAVLNQSEADIRKMFDTIRNSSGAADKAREAMQSFDLSVKQLQGTVDSIGISIGKVAAGALLPFVKAANAVLGPVAALPEPVKNLAAALVLLTAGYVGAKVAIGAFTAAMKIEAVATAQKEILLLAGSIRTDLVRDLGRGRDAVVAFVRSLNAANIAAAVTSMRGLATAAKVLAAEGLISAARGVGDLAVQLKTTSLAATAAGTSAQGLSAILQNGLAGGAGGASKALLGLSGVLKGLAAGTVTAGFVAIGAALAGVAVAAGGYALIMGKAWKETELARGPVEELEKGLAKLGVPLADTTALGGPLTRFLSDFSRGASNLVQQLIPIPGIADLVKGALDTLGQVLRSTPFGMAIEGALKLGGALKKAYEEAAKNQSIVEAELAFNKLSSNAANATNAAAGFIGQVRQMPTGQQLDNGQLSALKSIQEQLGLNRQAMEDYRKNLLKAAAAARAAGDKTYADELTRRAERAQVEIGLIDVQTDGLARVTAGRKAAAAAATEEKLSLDAVIEALTRREQLNQTAVLEAEAAALAQVAAGNLSAAQATAQKNAATVKALTEEIALIDAQLAKASAADQLEEKFAQLKQQRAQKAVQLYQLEAQEVEKRIALERELNRIIAEAPSRNIEAQLKSLDRQVTVANTLLNLSRALTDLEASRFSMASAVLAAQLEEAQARGATEGTINEIKARAAQVDAQAAVARLEGLQRAQALEAKVLEITQKRQILEANLAVNQARVELLQRQYDLSKAIADGDQRAAALAREGISIAQQKLGFAQENLGLIKQVQPLERQIAEAGRQKALNESQAAAYTATFKANLADAVKPGGELANAAGRTAVEFSELGAGTQNLIKGLSSSNGILGELSRRMLTVSRGSTIAAQSARQLGLFGRGSVGAYGSIGDDLTSAGGSAEVFAGSGIDSVTIASAQGAASLAQNMAAATQGAQAFYAALSAASGLPGARWAGGGVEAGGKYRINDGPGMRSLGQESFLSAAGRLSLINRPANSIWTAPSRGVVIPAAVTAKLQDQGLIDGGRSNRTARVRGGATPGRGGNAAMARLENAVNTLTQAVGMLARKDWNVQVQSPDGARQRKLLHLISGLT